MFIFPILIFMFHFINHEYKATLRMQLFIVIIFFFLTVKYNCGVVCKKFIRLTAWKKPPILVVIKYHKLKFEMSNDKLYNVLNSGNKHAKYAFLLISANTFSHFLLLCLIFRHVRNCSISIFPHNTWVSIWTIRTIAVRIYILAHCFQMTKN